MSETLTYGLTPGGFVRMRMPEIRAAIVASLAERTGYVFDAEPDGLAGQFVAVFAEREAALWELAEGVYLSPYPATAVGTSLDLAVSYAGVTRALARRSTARGLFYGTPGTVVPAGSVVESAEVPRDGTRPPRFEAAVDVAISGTNCAVLGLEVLSNVLATGAVFWIDYDGVRAQFTAPAGATAASVAAGLAAELTADGQLSSSDGGYVSVVSNANFSAAWSANLTLRAFASPGTLRATSDGPATAGPGALTRIVTPVPGWDSVTNPKSAVVGALSETDEALRARYRLGVFRLGAGTLPAIKANLRQDIADVASLAVYENATDVTDADGRPPHSVEVVIEGGDEDAIARRIRELKPAGIRAFGNTTVSVPDDTGYQHAIGFSRPEERWVWLRATLATTAEEDLPGDVNNRVVQAMVNAGNALGPGDNVFLQRLEGAGLRSSTGLARVTVTAAVTAPGAAAPALESYTTTDEAMNSRQRATFAIERVALF